MRVLFADAAGNSGYSSVETSETMTNKPIVAKLLHSDWQIKEKLNSVKITNIWMRYEIGTFEMRNINTFT